MQTRKVRQNLNERKSVTFCGHNEIQRLCCFNLRTNKQTNPTILERFETQWPSLVLQPTPSRSLLYLLALLKHLVVGVNVEGRDGRDDVAVHFHRDVVVGGHQSSEAGESLKRHHCVLRKAETLRD